MKYWYRIKIGSYVYRKPWFHISLRHHRGKAYSWRLWKHSCTDSIELIVVLGWLELWVNISLPGECDCQEKIEDVAKLLG